MEAKPSDSDVKAFYEGISLPEPRTDAILEMGRSVRESRRWKRLAVTMSFGFVFMTAIAAFLLIRTPIADDQPVIPSDSPLVSELEEDSSTLDHEAIRVVSVRLHGDACPKCRQMGGAMVDLQSEFDGQPVLFVTLDLSDSAHRTQSRLMSRLLGLEHVLDPDADAGFVVLTKPNGEVVEKLDATTATELLAVHVRNQLGRD